MTKAEIQRLRSLGEKAGRDSLGLFLVEGAKVVSELAGAGFAFESIYATDDWQPAGPTAVSRITAQEMGRISQLPTPSPVLGVARIERRPLGADALNRGWTLALDGIQDPGNVGTLLRIADWFGLSRVVLSPGCADLHSPKVVAASMGSFAHVASHVADLPPLLAATTVPIIGCDLQGDSVHGAKPVKDAVIVIGSEGQGLSDPVRRRVTRRVTIPRHGAGHAESLNAAIAAAIVCDNLRRATYG